MLSVPIKQILAFLAFCLVAVIAGTQIAANNWILIAPLYGGLLLYLFLATPKVTPEAIIIGGLTGGYIIGSKGFASLGPGFILPAELALILLAAVTVAYVPLRKMIPFRVDTLGMFILLFVAYGCMLMARDIPRYGLWAVRDFAMVYYAAFYFFAQPIARHAMSLNTLNRVLFFSFIIMIPLMLWFGLSPFSMLSFFTVGGINLIRYKGDLAAMTCAIGWLFFFFRLEKTRSIFDFALSAILLTLSFLIVSRAVYPGILVMVWLLFYLRSRVVVRFFTSAAVLALFPLAIFTVVLSESVSESRLVLIWEHMVSVVDLQGNYDYQHEKGEESINNNQWRLTWWSVLFDKVMTENPMLGLGFGTDITSDFSIAYWGDPDHHERTRSPHSMQMSAFGRMGILGLLIYLAITFAIAAQIYEVIMYCRRHGGPVHPALPYWSMCIIIYSSSTFGVVLEGPMGAVPFWAFLGIAGEITYRVRKEERKKDEVPLSALSRSENRPYPALSGSSPVSATRSSPSA